eukprot:tig00020961_g16645.t1
MRRQEELSVEVGDAPDAPAPDSDLLPSEHADGEAGEERGPTPALSPDEDVELLMLEERPAGAGVQAARSARRASRDEAARLAGPGAPPSPGAMQAPHAHTHGHGHDALERPASRERPLSRASEGNDFIYEDLDALRPSSSSSTVLYGRLDHEATPPGRLPPRGPAGRNPAALVRSYRAKERVPSPAAVKPTLASLFAGPRAGLLAEPLLPGPRLVPLGRLPRPLPRLRPRRRLQPRPGPAPRPRLPPRGRPRVPCPARPLAGPSSLRASASAPALAPSARPATSPAPSGRVPLAERPPQRPPERKDRATAGQAPWRWGSMTPGPGTYEVRDKAGGRTPAFSIKSRVAVTGTVGVLKDNPGPGAYEVRIKPAAEQTGGARGLGGSEDRFYMDLSHATPGAGTYEQVPWQVTRHFGGAFGFGVGERTAEVWSKLCTGGPSPDAYDLPPAIGPKVGPATAWGARTEVRECSGPIRGDIRPGVGPASYDLPGTCGPQGDPRLRGAPAARWGKEEQRYSSEKVLKGHVPVLEHEVQKHQLYMSHSPGHVYDQHKYSPFSPANLKKGGARFGTEVRMQ